MLCGARFRRSSKRCNDWAWRECMAGVACTPVMATMQNAAKSCIRYPLRSHHCAGRKAKSLVARILKSCCQGGGVSFWCNHIGSALLAMNSSTGKPSICCGHGTRFCLPWMKTVMSFPFRSRRARFSAQVRLRFCFDMCRHSLIPSLEPATRDSHPTTSCWAIGIKKATLKANSWNWPLVIQASRTPKRLSAHGHTHECEQVA